MIRRVLSSLAAIGAMALYLSGAPDDSGGGAPIRGKVLGGTTAQDAEAKRPSETSGLDPALRELAGSEDLVDVFVILREQPQQTIVPRHIDQARAGLAGLEERMAGLRKTAAPDSVIADFRRQRDSIIVRSRKAAVDEVRSAIAPGRDTVARRMAAIGTVHPARFWSTNMVAATVPGRALTDIVSWPEVSSVKPAGQRRMLLDTSVPTTGAPIWWEAGWNGADQAIAMLDSGMNAAHPAFAGLGVVQKISLESARNRPCFDDDASDPSDFAGHGTHVAGIMAARSAPGPGMAPGLGLLFSVKVAARGKAAPNCPALIIEDADWIAGAEQVLAEFPVRVINMSFGGNAGTEDDLAAVLIDRLVDLFDITAVVAAGNDGTSRATYQLSSPCVAYNVICVANVDTNRTVTRIDDAPNPSSSKGPTPGGRLKPDVAAPGTRISSASPAGDGPMDLTGTSMAAPHAAGAAAVMPGIGTLGANETKALLINSTATAGWNRATGWGAVNLATALEQREYVFRSSVGLGRNRSIGLFLGPVENGVRATAVWRRHVVKIEPESRSWDSWLTGLRLTAFDATRPLDAIAAHVDPGQNVKALELTGNGEAVFKIESPETAPPLESEQYAIAFSRKGYREVFAPRLTPTCAFERGAVMRFGTAVVRCTVTNTGELTTGPSSELRYLDPFTRRIVAVPAGNVVPGAATELRLNIAIPGTAPIGRQELLIDTRVLAFGELWMADTAAPFTVEAAALQDCTPSIEVKANFPLTSAQQTFPIDIKFPRYQSANPGVCSWTVSSPALADFVSILNNANSAVNSLPGTGDRTVTIRVNEALASTNPTRTSKLTIRVTSEINVRGAPAPRIYPATEITVTQQNKPR